MRKKILYLLTLLVLIVSLVSCSDDPRVAPLKMLIISITSTNGNVMYDKDYGARVIFMKPTDTALFEVVTNRLNDVKILNWSSNYESVASVVPNSEGNGFITALDYGVSRIVVTAKGTRTVGECYVIVKDDNSSEGIHVMVAHVDGLINSSEGYELLASSESELESKRLKLGFVVNDSNVSVTRVEWYLNGNLISSNKEFEIGLDKFGLYTLNCVVYGKKNGSLEIPVGSDSVTIKAKYKY